MKSEPSPRPLRRTVLLLAAVVSALAVGALDGSPTVDATVAPDPTGADVGASVDDPTPAEEPSDDRIADDEIPLLAGPVVSIERQELRAGDEIIVTLAGFESPFVNVAVCGNEARRGAGDCNMQGAKGREFDVTELTTRLRFRISTPPTPCPCLIRAASNGQSEIAIVPITLVDHPVADPVDPPEIGPVVEATISVSKAEAGPFDRLRTGLGGTTTYDVRVTARNSLTTPLIDLTAAATVGRGEDDDLALIELEPIPQILEPGQRWQQVVQVDLPRPVWGEAEWRLVVSGAGPVVEATTTTSNAPTALYVVVVVLVLDIAFILYRMRRRKRRQQRAVDVAAAGPVIDIDDDGTIWTLDDDGFDRDDDRERIGA